MVADVSGKLIAPTDVRVTCLPVTPSVTGRISSFADGRIVLADICYCDVAGESGAFWEIDWGTG